jgi:hypothetical protein
VLIERQRCEYNPRRLRRSIGYRPLRLRRWARLAEVR